MSIVLKQETVSIKDKDGKYRTLNTLSEKTTDKIVSEIIERIPPIPDVSSVQKQGCIIAISISNGSETLFSIGSEYEDLEQNEEKYQYIYDLISGGSVIGIGDLDVYSFGILDGIELENEEYTESLRWISDKYIWYLTTSGEFVRDVRKHVASYNDLNDKPLIPSKTSELENDSNFITSTNEQCGCVMHKSNSDILLLNGISYDLHTDAGLTKLVTSVQSGVTIALGDYTNNQFAILRGLEGINLVWENYSYIWKISMFAFSITRTEKEHVQQYDDSAIKEQIKSIEENIKDIELTKFPNVTIFGQPTINQGQLSNFSSTNYCQFPFIVNFQNRPFTLDFEITTGSDVSQQHNVFDSEFGLAFAVRNQRFVIAASTTGTNWNIGEGVGNHAVSPNTTYRVRMDWNLSNLTMSYSTDGGVNYILDITKPLSTQPYPKQMYIGITSDKSTIFNGIINLNYAMLTISNKVVWQGMDDVGIATRLAVDLSNVDEAGENKIREIYDAYKITELNDEILSGLTDEEKSTYFPSIKAILEYVNSRPCVLV